MALKTYRAGDSVEDYCRACKIDRIHTVIVASGSGTPDRVQCDICGSQHNYRGGPSGEAAQVAAARHSGGSAGELRGAFPLVTDRELTPGRETVDSMAGVELEKVIRRIIREESGLTAAVPAEKWRGGTMVLRPGNPVLQDKSWPIETFFHKVVMVRNRLRTLEQQVNASELPEDAKVKLQAYITGCYGSLTSFNVLFSDDEDQFKGSGGE